MSGKADKGPAIPRPSSSVILVSPKNEVLLLHRVQTSSSFASAHVFPGGNLSAQDGECPPAEDIKRHEDSPAYRRAAIRELFEESGILLAKDASKKMLAVGEEEREKGRKAIHSHQVTFSQWLQGLDATAEPDIDGLIPFTRWITPTNVPKRYTTQMYLYFLPLPLESDKRVLQEMPTEGERDEIQIPTSDGGIEVTAAEIRPSAEWLGMAGRGEIMLFPPQYMLLHLVSQHLDKQPRPDNSVEELGRRRRELIDFVHSGSTPWSEKCISPRMFKISSDGRAVLGLHNPGPELKGTNRTGELDRVVLVEFVKGVGPRNVEVKWKKDVLEEDREKSNL